MIFRWVDASRPEVLTDNPDDFREVIGMVWYPAVPGTGTETGYLPELSSLSEALAESGEVEVWQVSTLRLMSSESSLDAEPIKDQGAFPVVILSPGYGTNVEFYTSLAGEIASHGYVVVGLNHAYDVAAVELSDGSIAPFHEGEWSFSSSDYQMYITERIKVRTADVAFALDQLTLLNTDSQGRFAGLLDLGSVAAAGHSLGGVTASEVCKADPRFKSCLNWDGLQAGSPFSTDFEASPPSQPFLFLTKEAALNPRQIDNFKSMRESYWVTIHGASHDSFTDGPSLMPSLLPIPNRADRLMDLIQKYTLAFLSRWS
jgi:dienelactone hydrolase